MAKTPKAVDPKVTAKAQISAVLREALEARQIEVLDGTEYGMTAGTIIARLPEFDIQVKPIAPKAGVTRYLPQE